MFLEHPAEAFAAYRAEGVERVVCEEKHMGSRAVALVCRDAGGAHAGSASRRDDRSASTPGPGGPSSTTPRSRRRSWPGCGKAVGGAGLWDELATDWLLFDAELLPWSLKASGLLRKQYAAVGAAAGAVFPPRALRAGERRGRGVDVGGLLERQRERAASAAAFTDAYRRYCWASDGLDGVRLAPFQILAAEGAASPRSRTTSNSPGWTGW